MTAKCEVCGKELGNDQSTHCSEKCLFESIKNSQKFVPKEQSPKNETEDRMATAHILINCDVGFEKQVIEELKLKEGVQEVQGVWGTYDMIAKLECPTRERLREIVTWKIRKIPHIKSTLTVLHIR